MEKERIKFKAVHEGMGFHPFSDGLPYAPESKTKYQNGSGATAAGRPQFVTQAFATSASKTARQIQEAKRVHLPQTAPAPTPAKTVTFQKTDATEVLRARVFAYLLDSIIHAGFWLGTNLTALIFFKFQLDSEIIRENFPLFLMFYLVSQWVFIALQEMLFGSTAGKVFFKLEFSRNHRSLFLRSIVFMLGLVSFGLGLYFRPQDHLGELHLRQ